MGRSYFLDNPGELTTAVLTVVTHTQTALKDTQKNHRNIGCCQGFHLLNA